MLNALVLGAALMKFFAMATAVIAVLIAGDGGLTLLGASTSMHQIYGAIMLVGGFSVFWIALSAGVLCDISMHLEKLVKNSAYTKPGSNGP